jgi:hypothetical protein
MLAGPSNVKFGNSSALETTVTFEQEGTYSFSLSVSTQSTSATAALEIDVLKTLPEEAGTSPTATPVDDQDDLPLQASLALPFFTEYNGLLSVCASLFIFGFLL